MNGLNMNGLFKFGNKKPEGQIHEIAPPAEVNINPVDVYKEGIAIIDSLKMWLQRYEIMIERGNSFSFEEGEKLLGILKIVASVFEEVYELLKFDQDKANEIKKYHEKTLQKRKELKQMLDPMKPAQTEKK